MSPFCGGVGEPCVTVARGEPRGQMGSLGALGQSGQFPICSWSRNSTHVAITLTQLKLGSTSPLNAFNFRTWKAEANSWEFEASLVYCFSYFSVVIKQYNRGHLNKNEFIWGL